MNNLVELRIPGEAQFISTARLVISSLASSVDMDIEEIDDLKVSLSEACNIIIGQGPISMKFEIKENYMGCRVSLTDGPIQYESEDKIQLAKQILSVLVDEVEFNDREISFCKNRS